MDAQVLSNGHVYDVMRERSAIWQVMVYGAVIDDCADEPLPVAAPFAVSVNEPLLRASGHMGRFALAGDPDVALCDHTVPHSLDVGITSSGFHDLDLTVNVPASPVFPVEMIDTAMRRLPVALSGRVIELATGNPVSGARIDLVGPTLANPQRAILLSSPLAWSVSSAASVRGRSLSPVASAVPVKAVKQEAPAGAAEILLDNRQDLVANQLLRFGPEHRSHFAQILSVSSSPANLSLPGMVTLTAALARGARMNDPAVPFTLGAPAGANASPVGQAYAGEAVLVLDALPVGDVLAITDPPHPPAFHGQGAVSDANGRYLIQGLCRLRRPVLRTSAAGFGALTRTVPMRWSEPLSTLDWRMAP
jgi:hypothetical protein